MNSDKSVTWVLFLNPISAAKEKEQTYKAVHADRREKASFPHKNVPPYCLPFITKAVRLAEKPPVSELLAKKKLRS